MSQRLLDCCRFAVLSGLLLFVLAVPAHAQDAATGTWNGTLNATDHCGSGTGGPDITVPFNSAVTFDLLQFGEDVAGNLTIASVPEYNESCQVVRTFPLVLPVSARLSGTSFSGTVAGSFAFFDFTGSLSGGSMSLTLTSSDTEPFVGTITATRTSSQTPDSRLTGSYSGTYTNSFVPCRIGPPLTYSGGLSGVLLHTGGSISGFFVITGGKNDKSDGQGGPCTIVDAPDEVVLFSGQVNGNNLAGGITLIHSGDMNDETEFVPFNATISGNTISGALTGGDGFTFNFTLNRTGGSPPPTILSFTASPSPIPLGGTSTLFFSTSGAATVTIDNGVGTVPSNGSVSVSPTTTTTYTLTATGQDGTTSTATAKVDVITQPAILVASFPQGLLQAAGTGGATDRYVLTNIGGTTSSITLGQSGPPFFTQSPATFTIAPGASQTVILTGLAQATGSFEGSSNPSGSGVPAGLTIRVRLLSAAQPQPGTIPRPTPSTNRVDVTDRAGSLEYTNNGNATLNGILVSDVPWIIPQSGVIAIPPGQTVTLTFTIDRGKRPDGDAPNGSVNGNMTLVYLLDAGTGSGSLAGLSDLRIQPMDGTPPTGARPITVVDTAVPVTSANAVPPYAAGEIGFFMPGFAQRTGIVSDLAIVNALSPTPLSNAVRLFYATSGTGGVNATSASISTLPPNISVQFASAVKTVFNRDNQTGSLQVRSQSAFDKLSLSAGIFSTMSPRGFFGGTLPVFRSDRSVGVGEKLYLPGVKKDSSTRSDLYLQETAGFEASVRTEFVDAQGNNVVPMQMSTVPAFGMLELTDAAPALAVSAVVTNLSVTGGRLAAHAVVLDSVTSDAGSVVDWNRKNGTDGSKAQLVPLAVSKTGATTTRTEVAIMNSGSGTASGTLKFFSTTGTARKRGVKRGGSGSGLLGRIGSFGRRPAPSSAITPLGDVTITLEPGRTRVMTDALGSELGVPSGASGYLLFTPTSGSVAITSRTVSSAAGQQGFFGAAIPAVALSAGLGAGRSRQFTGIEDAAPATVASSKSGTFRSGFGLIETAGKSVTVRATLRYAATVPGGLANVRATASKEYQLAPRGALTVTDLGRAIFGPGRDAIGDLHNLQLDFDVVSGEGAVVPYTLSTDNGSGDSVMRIE